MIVKLPHRLPWVVFALPLIAGPLVAQVAQVPPAESSGPHQAGLVVLQNGEVLAGHIVRSGERILVTLPGREISLRPGEVDVVAGTLDEAYRLKRAKVRPTDVGGRLDLANWCLRHNLLASANEELAAVATVQPFEPRLKALGQRLAQALERQAMAVQASYQQNEPAAKPGTGKTSVQSATRGEPPSSRTDTARVWPPVAAPQSPIVKPPRRGDDSPRQADTVEAATPEVVERFVRSLPSGAVEEFTASIHPTIARGCATARCHAPGNQSEFTLLRLPQSRTVNRRLTQRNLYNTVQLVDFDKPEESRLLAIAGQPHGPLKAGVFGDQRSPKYRELAAWVSRLTGKPVHRDEATTEPIPSGIAWDRLQRGADRTHLAEQAKLEAILDQFEPNRPAEIRPATRPPASGNAAKKQPSIAKKAENAQKSAAHSAERTLNSGDNGTRRASLQRSSRP
jgi:hypothetical protein